jgi:hypothetical protein
VLQDDIDGVALRAAKSEPCLIAALGAGWRRSARPWAERAVGVLGPSQWEPDAAPMDVGPPHRGGSPLPWQVMRRRPSFGNSTRFLQSIRWRCQWFADPSLCIAIGSGQLAQVTVVGVGPADSASHQRGDAPGRRNRLLMLLSALATGEAERAAIEQLIQEVNERLGDEEAVKKAKVEIQERLNELPAALRPCQRHRRTDR